MKFLVIDDDKSIRTLYEVLLNRYHREVNADFSVNGKEALDMALSTDYDLILSDIDMPVMDGISFHRELRGNNSLKADRVAFVSGCDEASYMTYINSNSLPYLAKPFRMKEFYSFIEPLVDSIKICSTTDFGGICNRRSRRKSIEKTCIVEPLVCYDTSLVAKAVDYSEGGLGLVYSGESLQKGLPVKISIDELDILERNAIVAWTAPASEGFVTSGVSWT